MNSLIHTILLIVFLSFVYVGAHAQTVYDLGWYNAPIREHYYEISNSEELAALSYVCNSFGKTFENDTVALTENIDMGDMQTINNFAGYLNGNEHTISNVDKVIFSRLSTKGTIANLIVSGYISTNTSNYSVFVITCEGIIVNCINHVDLWFSQSNEFSFIGAFCSKLNNGTILNCKNYGNITDKVSASSSTYVQRCGGLVGQVNNAQIIHSCNYGSVTASCFSFVNCGGIVGDLQDGIVKDCQNFGKIKSTISPDREPSSNFAQSTGGIVGLAQGSSKIDACVNYEEVSNNCYMVAGIVGHAQHTHILNCINYASITSTDYYYFGCANGICSSYQGKQTYFVNCINTGSISSTSNGYTATAGGTCSDISNAIVANLVNLGSVSAHGRYSSSFQIENYEADSETTIDNTATDISGINVYNSTQPYSDQGITLINWKEDEGRIELQPFLTCYIQPLQGKALLYYYYSMDLEQTYYIHLYANDEQKDTIAYGYNDHMFLEGLKPDTEYMYSISEAFLYDNPPITGSFTTLPIAFYTNTDQVNETKTKVQSTYTADGVYIIGYGFYYKQSYESQWIRAIAIDNFTMSFDAYPIEKAYFIKPFVITQWGEYEGTPISFTTNKITPVLEMSDIDVNRMTIKCTNYAVFENYDWGLIIHNAYNTNDSIVQPATETGIFDFNDLQIGGNYIVYYYLYSKEVNITELVDQCQLNRLKIDQPIYVSPTAFMLRLYYVDSYSAKPTVYIESKDMYAIQSPSDFTSTQKIDDGLYYATIKMPESGYIQYRLNSSSSFVSDWLALVNPTTNCEKVPTFFTNIRLEKKNNQTVISCKKVDGELKAIEVGLEYKFDFQTSFFQIAMSNEIDMITAMDYLIPGYTYIGRFYAITEYATYYSDDFKFTSDELEQAGPVQSDINICQKEQQKAPQTYSKIIRDGRLFILHNNKQYTLQGQLVK